MYSNLRKWFYALAYLGNPPWDTGISPLELMDFLRSHKPGRALDLGCGSGTNLLTLCQHGWGATGIDFSGRAITRARRRLEGSGCHARAIRADVTRKLPVEGGFDLILDIGCYHDLDGIGKDGYRNNIRAHLNTGGNLLMYAHWFTEDHPRGTGVNEEDIHAFSEFLAPEKILHATDRRDRHTAWLTFKRPGTSLGR